MRASGTVTEISFNDERETSAPPTSVEAEDARRGLRPLEGLAPAVLFALIAICIVADLVDDLTSPTSTGHLAGMFIGTLLAITGLVLMLRMLAASRALVRTLESRLDWSRADAVRYREQAGQLLHGVGTLIDQQFDEWGLSPSEREVGLLLLKGLSLKSIASLRDASEPTVRQQAQAVYRKAKLTGRAELAAFFLEDLLLPQRPEARGAPLAATGTRR
jgi:DNA-binding CsgD family transcriptional regulator